MARVSGASALTAVTLFLAITACFSADSVTDQPESILVQILGSKYTTLVKLLADADLLSDLESDERFNEGVTIFATSDQYFVEKVSPSVLEFLQQPKNVGLLRQVLLSHIVAGRIGARSWYPGETVKTFSGNDAHLYLDSGDLKVNNAVVKEFAVLEAADGVVHSLEGFLVPEDIEDAAQGFRVVFEEQRRVIIEKPGTSAPPPSQSPVPVPPQAPAPGPSAALSFTQLLSLLEEVAPALLKLLQGDKAVSDLLAGLIASGQSLTVFAPTDAAINGANFTGYNTSTVLLNHVVAGPPYTSAELLALAAGSTPSRRLLQATLTTLAGNDLTLTKDSSGALLVNNVPVSKDLVSDPSQVGAVQVDGVLIPDNAKLTPITASPPPPPPPSSGCKFGASVILLLVSLAFGGVLVL